MYVNNNKSATIWARNKVSAVKWEKLFERNNHYVTHCVDGGKLKSFGCSSIGSEEKTTIVCL